MTPRKRRAGDELPPDRVLTDPRAIRALAHPARLAVLEELGLGRELTATDCAEVAGLSASAMSYHLRALEKWGFVEPAAASGDGRERPWRATSRGWRIDSMPTPLVATAASAVTSAVFERVNGDLGRWYEHERDQPKEWVDVAVVENYTLWLTADEAAELATSRAKLIEVTSRRTAAKHPEGARRVRALSIVVPLEFG